MPDGDVAQDISDIRRAEPPNIKPCLLAAAEFGNVSFPTGVRAGFFDERGPNVTAWIVPPLVSWPNAAEQAMVAVCIQFFVACFSAAWDNLDTTWQPSRVLVARPAAIVVCSSTPHP